MPRLVLFAGLLTLGSACGDPPKTQDAASLGLPIVERPAEATRGAPRAFLGAATGALTITDAEATPLEAIAGAPLLADDKLLLGADGLAVIIFTNGNVLRLNGPIEQELRGLAAFNSKPVGDNLEAQLIAALSDRDRERLSGANERIGGWQLRLKAIEAPAPESESADRDAKDAMAQPAPAPAPEPEAPGPQAGDGADTTPTEDRASGYGGGNPSESGESGTLKPDPAVENKKEPKSPKTVDASQPYAGSPVDGSMGLDNISSHDEDVEGDGDGDAPKSSAGQGNAKLPLLSFAAASWIQAGDRVTVPTKLRDELATCLRPIPGKHVTVELTLSSGTITTIKVRNHSSTCAKSFKDKPFTGISKSGSIRIVFER